MPTKPKAPVFAGWGTIATTVFQTVERRWELYTQVTFQKHVRESKQSYKAVLSVHKDRVTRGDRVPPLGSRAPVRWRLRLTLQALFLLKSLSSCVGISNRMDYLTYEESIALDSDFTSYLYHLLAGIRCQPGLTSQSFFPQL